MDIVLLYRNVAGLWFLTIHKSQVTRRRMVVSYLVCMFVCFIIFMSTCPVVMHPTNGTSLIEDQRELRRVQRGVTQLF